MTPAATDFTSRTITAFAGLLAIATDQFEAASLAVEKGEFDQAAALLRDASEVGRQASGGARTLADILIAEASGVFP
jgi:hypothetical protein